MPTLLRHLDTKLYSTRFLALKLRFGTALLLCCSAALTSLSHSAYAEPLAINIILSANSGLYKEFSDALTNDLVGSGATIKVFDTTQPQPDAKLIVAVGIKAATLAASSHAKYILNVMITKSGHEKLLHDFPKRDNTNSYTSIYLDQPIERQLGLIVAAFPNRKRLGVLFDTSTLSELKQLQQLAPDYGIDLYEKEVANPEAMFDTLQSVLQHSDVLLALPAPEIYNSSTLRNILVSTYQSHTPVVGFSSSYVKAGAICAVFSTPAQLATQTSSSIKKFIETNTLPPAQNPTFYEISVNERVAQSMGIPINNHDELSKKMSTKRKRAP